MNEHSTHEEIAEYLREHGPYRYTPEGSVEAVYVHTVDVEQGWALSMEERKILGADAVPLA